MRSILGLVVALLLVAPLPARAGETVRPDGRDTVELAEHYEAMFDPGGTMPLDQVMTSADFRPLAGRVHDLGIRPGNAWVRVRVDLSDQSPARRWRFTADVPWFDSADLYVLDDSGHLLVHERFGIKVGAPAERAYFHWVDLAGVSRKSVVLYLRFDSRYALLPQTSLMTEAASLRRDALYSRFHGLLAGATIVAALFFAAMAVILPNSLYTLGLLGSLTTLVTSLYNSGLSRPLGLCGPAIDEWLVMQLTGACGQILMFLLVERICRTRDRYPRLVRMAGIALGSGVLFQLAVDFLRPHWGVIDNAIFFLASCALATAMASAPSLSRRTRLAAAAVIAPFAVVLEIYLVSANLWLPEMLPFSGLVLHFLPISLAFLTLGMAVTISVQLRRELQDMVALRTRELGEATAATEQALAGERTARAHLRTFIDMATHEFKSPLTTIDATAQVLELMADQADVEVRKRLVLIRQSVGRIVGLVDSCLDDERHEDMTLKPGRLSPAEMMMSVVEQNPCAAGRVRIEQSAGQPDSWVADGELLGIALGALIDNALKYSQPDNWIDVAAQLRDGMLTFTVADRGPGIPEAESELVFAKYFRGSNGTAVSGTGVGLHFVRVIAEMHGGRVSVMPREGGGSIFSLSVPQRH